MKIALFAAGCYPIPPPRGVIFAPIDIVKSLAEGLTKKGHSVSVFAPEGSKLKCEIITGKLKPIFGENNIPIHPVFSKPYVRDEERKKICSLWDQYLLSHLYKIEREGRFDIINIHLAERALPFAFMSETPTVYTLHDPIYPWMIEAFKLFSTKNQYFTTLSNAQRKFAPGLNYAATIHNGVDLKLFPFSANPKGQFLFLGRILPKKGVDIAVKIARLINKDLVIVGSLNGEEFFRRKIRPYLNKKIRYVGWVAREKTYQYYGQAKALLSPIQWDEPFGLTFIEAMACGTPVIAFKRGAASEVIKNEKTGFLIDSVDKNGKINIKGFVEAIKKVDQIDRGECRRWVEKQYTIEKMINEYEKVFLKIISKNRK